MLKSLACCLSKCEKSGAIWYAETAGVSGWQDGRMVVAIDIGNEPKRYSNYNSWVKINNSSKLMANWLKISQFCGTSVSLPILSQAQPVRGGPCSVPGQRSGDFSVCVVDARLDVCWLAIEKKIFKDWWRYMKIESQDVPTFSQKSWSSKSSKWCRRGQRMLSLRSTCRKPNLNRHGPRQQPRPKQQRRRKQKLLVGELGMDMTLRL